MRRDAIHRTAVERRDTSDAPARPEKRVRGEVAAFPGQKAKRVRGRRRRSFLRAPRASGDGKIIASPSRRETVFFFAGESVSLAAETFVFFSRGFAVPLRPRARRGAEEHHGSPEAEIQPSANRATRVTRRVGTSERHAARVLLDKTRRRVRRLGGVATVIGVGVLGDALGDAAQKRLKRARDASDRVRVVVVVETSSSGVVERRVTLSHAQLDASFRRVFSPGEHRRVSHSSRGAERGAPRVGCQTHRVGDVARDEHRNVPPGRRAQRQETLQTDDFRFELEFVRLVRCVKARPRRAAFQPVRGLEAHRARRKRRVRDVVGESIGGARRF